MNRIVVLDYDTPARAQLAAALGQIRNLDVVIAADEEELVSRLTFHSCQAVFADADLLSDAAARLVAAVREAPERPMVVIAANEKREGLDAGCVTLLVRKPYDVPMVAGILLAAVPPLPFGGDSATDSPSVR
jgi:DNA-binding response OmpR family regulator